MSKTTKTILSISAGALMIAGAFAVLPSVTGSANISDEVKTTLESGDYAAFQEQASERLLSKVDSEEKFGEFQEKFAQREEIEAEVTEAVKNNDFEAFKAIKDEKMAQRESDDKETKEIDEEKLKEKFDEMVSEYEETGEIELKRNGRRGHRGSRRSSDKSKS